MTCKNCKYFDPFKDAVGYPKNYGYCDHPKIVDDLGIPGKDTSMPTDGIYATCDEQRGELQVGEDFGCRHFEEK